MTERILRVLQFTDTHLYDTADGALLGINTRESFAAVTAQALRDQGPADAVLATGDLTHEGGDAAYRYLRQQLDALAAPVYCLPGNHDEGRMLARHLDGERVRSVKSAILGNWLFCLLDSTVPGNDGGHLDARELGLLAEQLAAHPHHHALVGLHHQPVPVGSPWLDTMAVDNAEAFFAVIDRFPQVRGILWGHVHQAFDAARGTVRLMGSPSTCIQFRPGSADFSLDDRPPGYRWLKLFPDGHMETAVERLATMPGSVDPNARGY